MLNSDPNNFHLTIVEDDPFAQEFYKLIFSKSGYSTEIIKEGDELFSFLEQNQTNLVIMDINLKNCYLEGNKVDGVILAQKLKGNIKTNYIPVLMVTAFTEYKGDRIDKFADDFIIKPIVDFNNLLKKVGNLVEKQRHK